MRPSGFLLLNDLQRLAGAGRKAEAAARTTSRIDRGGLATKTVGAFGHQGQGIEGAGGDAASAAGTGRFDPEKRAHLIHAILKKRDGFRRIFR